MTIFSKALSTKTTLIVLGLSLIMISGASLVYMDSIKNPGNDLIPDVQFTYDDLPKIKENYSHPYQFTTDMFENRIKTFHKALINYHNKPNIQYLEVGLYEGRSLLWVLENILIHPSSSLTGIDLFPSEDTDIKPKLIHEHGFAYGRTYKERYFHNIKISNQEHRIKTLVGYSQNQLKTLTHNT